MERIREIWEGCWETREKVKKVDTLRRVSRKGGKAKQGFTSWLTELNIVVVIEADVLCFYLSTTTLAAVIINYTYKYVHTFCLS